MVKFQDRPDRFLVDLKRINEDEKEGARVEMRCARGVDTAIWMNSRAGRKRRPMPSFWSSVVDC